MLKRYVNVFTLFISSLSINAFAQCFNSAYVHNFESSAVNLNYEDTSITDGCLVFTINSTITQGYIAIGNARNDFAVPTPVITGNTVYLSATGTEPVPLSCQFSSANTANNFKLVSFNAEFYGHNNGGAPEIYNIVGYDNNVEVARVNGFDVKTGGTKGTGNSAITYTKSSHTADGSNSGTLAFGAGWQNIDKVVFVPADPNPSFNYLCVILDDISLAPPVTALPVQLGAFSAKIKKDGVSLNWKADTEINNDKYLLSHSVDGKDYSLIGSISSTQEMNYSFEHAQPAFGVNYYKLQQRDKDGKINDLGDRVINYTLSADRSLLIYPNPATEVITFNNSGFRAIEIYNSSGMLVLKQMVTGLNSINVSQLAKGTYTVKLSGSASSADTTSKFVKK